MKLALNPPDVAAYRLTWHCDGSRQEAEVSHPVDADGPHMHIHNSGHGVSSPPNGKFRMMVKTSATAPSAPACHGRAAGKRPRTHHTTQQTAKSA